MKKKRDKKTNLAITMKRRVIKKTLVNDEKMSRNKNSAKQWKDRNGKKINNKTRLSVDQELWCVMSSGEV